MSDTPRVDRAAIGGSTMGAQYPWSSYTFVDADQARTLERELVAVTREREEMNERWAAILTDELAESHRLMHLGGAREAENFTAFAERVIAERDALRAENERLRGACRKAVAALAHASERMPQYINDYEALSAALQVPTP